MSETYPIGQKFVTKLRFFPKIFSNFCSILDKNKQRPNRNFLTRGCCSNINVIILVKVFAKRPIGNIGISATD